MLSTKINDQIASILNCQLVGDVIACVIYRCNVAPQVLRSILSVLIETSEGDEWIRKNGFGVYGAASPVCVTYVCWCLTVGDCVFYRMVGNPTKYSTSLPKWCSRPNIQCGMMFLHILYC